MRDTLRHFEAQAAVETRAIAALEAARQESIRLPSPAEIDMMLIRLHQNRDGAVLPPDLGTGALKPPDSKATQGQITTLLDIDHFHGCESEYDQDAFEDVAWKLKEASYEVFADHVVTEHALKVWA